MLGVDESFASASTYHPSFQLLVSYFEEGLQRNYEPKILINIAVKRMCCFTASTVVSLGVQV